MITLHVYYMSTVLLHLCGLSIVQQIFASHLCLQSSPMPSHNVQCRPMPSIPVLEHQTPRAVCKPPNAIKNITFRTRVSPSSSYTVGYKENLAFRPRVSPSFLLLPSLVELPGVLALHEATVHHLRLRSPPQRTVEPGAAPRMSKLRISRVAVMEYKSGSGA